MKIIVDKTEIKNSKRFFNNAGYLVLPDCVIARSGLLEYSDVLCEDGKVVAEGALITVNRPPEALEKCYLQFKNLPLTLEHPQADAVTPENAKGLVVGTLGSNPRYIVKKGIGYIINDIVVYDEDAIKEIQEGTCDELSAGYETAFRQVRGVDENTGKSYEAEQFFLSPNHVALVPKGRCGSECRVCDNKEEKPNKKQEEGKKMKKKSNFKYLLQIGDNEEVVELTEEQAEELQKENPDLEVEEMDEDEVELTEESTDEEVDVEVTGDEEDEEDPAVEDEDEEDEEDPAVEDEDEEDEEDPAVEDEDEEVEVAGVDTDEDGGSGEELYEVQFDDGTTGKMDKNAYEHCSRFIEAQKKADSQSFGAMTRLTNTASRILGDSFEVEKFIIGDRVDVRGIKKAVIHHVMPSIVTKNLKGDSLDRLYQSAVASSKKKTSAWQQDFKNLTSANTVSDSLGGGLIEKARKNRLKKINNQ